MKQGIYLNDKYCKTPIIRGVKFSQNRPPGNSRACNFHVKRQTLRYT